MLFLCWQLAKNRRMTRRTMKNRTTARRSVRHEWWCHQRHKKIHLRRGSERCQKSSSSNHKHPFLYFWNTPVTYLGLSNMLWRPLLTLLSIYTASAFVPSPTFRSNGVRLFSSTEEALDVPLVVEGKNIEVTDALMAHIQKRIGGPLKKLSGSGKVIECDVILSVTKNPKVRHSRRRRRAWRELRWLRHIVLVLTHALLHCRLKNPIRSKLWQTWKEQPLSVPMPVLTCTTVLTRLPMPCSESW